LVAWQAVRLRHVSLGKAELMGVALLIG
jgi:hypothetical protein